MKNKNHGEIIQRPFCVSSNSSTNTSRWDLTTQYAPRYCESQGAWSILSFSVIQLEASQTEHSRLCGEMLISTWLEDVAMAVIWLGKKQPWTFWAFQMQTSTWVQLYQVISLSLAHRTQAVFAARPRRASLLLPHCSPYLKCTADEAFEHLIHSSHSLLHIYKILFMANTLYNYKYPC